MYAFLCIMRRSLEIQMINPYLMNLLEINNLTLRFSQQKALHNISFSLEKKEIMGLVGESGSGKSLTAYAIAGLLPASVIIESGEILFKGIDLLTLSSRERRQFSGKEIAMVFQEPMTSLNPSMTCGKQVLEAILLHEKITKKKAIEKVLSLFEQVLLPEPKRIFNSYPHQLSGGQKQRVVIAMAISCNPSLLIADEPTTALDVTIQKEILFLLKKLQETLQMSIIFISHDLGAVHQLCHKIMVMFQGKMIEKNTVKNIFTHPKKSYTRGLIACRPRMDIRLKRLITVSDFIENTHAAKEVETAEERKQHQQKIYHRQPLLEIKNLSKYYPRPSGIFRGKKYFKAIDGISFTIYPGETVGLVGESGCGKTTLSRTLLQLQKPTAGEIYYKGEDLAKASNKRLRELRKEIQIIFQDPYSSLNPRKTIAETLIEPMRVHRIGKNKKECLEKAIYLLKQVSLSEGYLKRYPHEFSGGQRQRIAIARALALNPQFIICDESVSSLDISIQAQVLNLLNELKKEFGLTYLFISHDLSVVKHMSNQLLVMNKGKIEEMGDADKIYHHPEKKYTQRLIDAIPKIIN